MELAAAVPVVALVAVVSVIAVAGMLFTALVFTVSLETRGVVPPVLRAMVASFWFRAATHSECRSNTL